MDINFKYIYRISDRDTHTLIISLSVTHFTRLLSELRSKLTSALSLRVLCSLWCCCLCRHCRGHGGLVAPFPGRIVTNSRRPLVRCTTTGLYIEESTRWTSPSHQEGTVSVADKVTWTVSGIAVKDSRFTRNAYIYTCRWRRLGWWAETRIRCRIRVIYEGCGRCCTNGQNHKHQCTPHHRICGTSFSEHWIYLIPSTIHAWYSKDIVFAKPL